MAGIFLAMQSLERSIGREALYAFCNFLESERVKSDILSRDPLVAEALYQAAFGADPALDLRPCGDESVELLERIFARLENPAHPFWLEFSLRYDERWKREQEERGLDAEAIIGRSKEYQMSMVPLVMEGFRERLEAIRLASLNSDDFLMDGFLETFHPIVVSIGSGPLAEFTRFIESKRRNCDALSKDAALERALQNVISGASKVLDLRECSVTTIAELERLFSGLKDPGHEHWRTYASRVPAQWLSSQEAKGADTSILLGQRMAECQRMLSVMVLWLNARLKREAEGSAAALQHR